jgi:hypothetical protein
MFFNLSVLFFSTAVTSDVAKTRNPTCFPSKPPTAADA